MSNILVLKADASCADGATLEMIKENVSGDWKFNPKTLFSISHVAVLCNDDQGVLRVKHVFDLKRNTISFNLITGRISNLEFDDCSSEELSSLESSHIQYGTGNPATSMKLREFKKLCQVGV